ncbi:MAG: hypothetical protein ISR97_01335 [Nitrospira sp.]|nr:hypothetical protein [Nitrospira sp.]
MTNSYSAGEDIEAWCTKCKLELGHTIVAMIGKLPKRVKCNTCNSLHNFRAEPAKKRTSGQKTKSRGKTYKDYLTLLIEADRSNARAYSIKSTFRENDVIEHPKFGTGLVKSTVKSNKIEVIFEDGPKLLIHNME